jgi:succinate dehydrogenase/fumarate reductase-like Fe-S protein
MLCTEIRELAEDADRYYSKYENGDPTARRAFSDSVRRLKQYINEEQAYSATAKCMLMGLKTRSEAARAALDV